VHADFAIDRRTGGMLSIRVLRSTPVRWLFHHSFTCQSFTIHIPLDWHQGSASSISGLELAGNEGRSRALTTRSSTGSHYLHRQAHLQECLTSIGFLLFSSSFGVRSRTSTRDSRHNSRSMSPGSPFLPSTGTPSPLPSKLVWELQDTPFHPTHTHTIINCAAPSSIPPPAVSCSRMGRQVGIPSPAGPFHV